MSPAPLPPVRGDAVAAAARDRPEAPAIVTTRGITTYAGLERMARSIAGGLYAAGVRQGDRVGIAATPEPVTVAALRAVPRLGATAVPVAADVGTRSAALLTALGVGVLVAGNAPGWSGPRFDPTALAAAPEVALWGYEPSAPQVIIHTSGTGGGRRGVVLTGHNLDAAAIASQDRLGTGADERWLAVLPLHHIGGFSILWRSALAGSAVLPAAFDVATVPALAVGATVASLVPAMLRRLLDVGAAMPAARFVLVGGGPLPSSLFDRAEAAGLTVLPTYGMTEMASQVATAHPEDPPEHRRTPGRPLSGVEVEVRAADGAALAADEPGELWVRGPMLSPGYAGEPGRAEGEWHRTGDLGRLRGDGYLEVLGRVDDVIVSGGVNLHPEEIEAVLVGAPGVADAAVVGLPDETWGRAAAAAVVATGEAVDTERLAELVRSRLGPAWVPKRWLVVPAIDRSALGKVDRAAVAARFVA